MSANAGHKALALMPFGLHCESAGLTIKPCGILIRQLPLTNQLDRDHGASFSFDIFFSPQLTQTHRRMHKHTHTHTQKERERREGEREGRERERERDVHCNYTKSGDGL